MAVNQRQNGVLADAPLDDTNLALLAELQADARLSLAELGRRVGLSAPAVADRLARLYLIRAHVRDVEHLEEVIDRFALYGQTTSSILQSAPVAGRGVAL